MREQHGGEGLKGAHELADIGFFDSEVSEVEEDGVGKVDQDNVAPASRQLYVIKREWVAREVGSLTVFNKLSLTS